jgi:VanZ family protein
MLLRHLLPSIAWAIFILILTLSPGQFVPDVSFKSLIKIDKLVHYFIFMMLVYLLIRGFNKQFSYENLRKKSILIAVMTGVLYGCIIEGIQTFIPGRSFEIYDMIANSAGCIFGIIAYRLFPGKKPSID